MDTTRKPDDEAEMRRVIATNALSGERTDVEHFLRDHVHPDTFRSRRHFVTCFGCTYRSKPFASIGEARQAGRAHCKEKNA